jgi:hypothetical protein
MRACNLGGAGCLAHRNARRRKKIHFSHRWKWMTFQLQGYIRTRAHYKTTENAIEDTSVVRPRNATRLVRQHRLDCNPFIVGEFVAHDSSPSLGV